MNEQSLLIKLLESGWAQCAAVASDHGNVLLTALVAGLVGGLTHCIGMCGPFVVSQITARMEHVPAARMGALTRLQGALLLPYHFGRATTYILLGVLAGLLSDGLTALIRTAWLAPVLLSAAAVFFLIYGLSGFLPRLTPDAGFARRFGTVLSRPLKSLFAAPVGWRGYGLGLALGFIPCGLVYGALMLAGGAGGGVAGGMVMASFALGTVPALCAVGVMGQLAARHFKSLMTPVGRGVMVLNAGILVFLAWSHIA